MDRSRHNDFLDDFAGALDWWREAGVDMDFADTPQQWLAAPGDPAADEDERRPPPRRASAPPPEAAAPRIDAAALPADLAGFAQWWLAEPLLDDGATAGRIAPAGPAGARVMVIVEEPEAEDRDALLCGPQGRLLDAMLAAFGMARSDVYLASALPRHMPAADWRKLEDTGFGTALAHLVGLVAPERLWVLGSNALSLLGHESPQRPAVLRNFNQEGADIPLLACWGLPALLGQPRAKPVLWKAWLEWTSA